MSILSMLPAPGELAQEDRARDEAEAGPERPGWRDEWDGEEEE